jgi:hypothetical protein
MNHLISCELHDNVRIGDCFLWCAAREGVWGSHRSHTPTSSLMGWDGLGIWLDFAGFAGFCQLCVDNSWQQVQFKQPKCAVFVQAALVEYIMGSAPPWACSGGAEAHCVRATSALPDPYARSPDLP